MAWQRRWHIDSKPKWLRILGALVEFGLDFEKHPVELIAREVVHPLSPPQRRLFHAICADAAPHFGMTPREYKEGVKDYYFGEEWRELDFSTEDLDHEHYGHLIETAYMIAAEHGVYLADRRPR